MSRQSARKVKLTSKFEEFSTSRLASIQRLAHPPHGDVHAHLQPQTANNEVLKPEKTVTPKVEREPPKAAVVVVETPKVTEQPPQNHAPAKERTPHKVLRHKAPPVTPATPAYEPATTPQPYGHPLPKLTANGKIRGRPRKCWQPTQQKAETAVKPMSSTREELLRLREETANLKAQLEQRTAEYEDLKRQSSYTGQTVPKVDYDDLKDQYQRDITHAKRHEWCVVCLNPSRYYCCWNTTYCSQKCQVSDWYQRHVKSCERRRALKTVS